MDDSAQPIRIACCGLATFDVVSVINEPVGPNIKIAATTGYATAGGPALNAAFAAAALGAQVTYIGAFGVDPTARAAAREAAEAGITLFDHAPTAPGFPVSTVLVKQETGERSVISQHGGVMSDRIARERPRLLQGALESLDHADVVLIDGHYPELALQAVQRGRAQNAVIVFDGGSWKPQTSLMLPWVDVAAVSADFRVPAEDQVSAVSTDPGPTGSPQPAIRSILETICEYGPAFALRTQGAEAIEVWDHAERSYFKVAPPTSRDVVDTLGAGDVFHGALALALATRLGNGLRSSGLLKATEWAARVATESVAHPGARVDRYPV